MRLGWTWAMHPVTTTFFPCFLSSEILESMRFSVVSTTVHVFSTTTSASSASAAGSYPRDAMTSESSRPSPKFMVHP